ncbi:MAG: endopeptidase La [Gemmatimonadota bacterium]
MAVQIVNGTERDMADLPTIHRIRDLPALAVEGVVYYPGSTARVEAPVSGTGAAPAGRDVASGGPDVVLLWRLVPPGGSASREPEQHPYYRWAAWGTIEPAAVGGEAQQLAIRVRGRARLLEVLVPEPRLAVRIEEMDDVVLGTSREEALTRTVLAQVREMVALSPQLTPDLAALAGRLRGDPGQLADFVSSGLDLSLAERLALLAEPRVEYRLEAAANRLAQELEVLRLGRQIQDQLRDEIGKTQREQILREQMRAIQRELGESGDQGAAELQDRVERAVLPPEARRAAERELQRLSQTPPGSAEGTVSRTYLDWLASLPWGRSSRERLDAARARRILDADHEGLEKVKDRIVEYVAVRQLRRDTRGPILCFAGPPGVGKTSLARSIARALGRRFARISLGGVRDEAEVRGHRRTYVGALPGRLVQALRTAGADNPVLLLDEIDKLGADLRGDPGAALLEVLDPAQNSSFSDHYLDVPVDLSKVLFVATANETHRIPPALVDRLEVIQLPGYTEQEKVRIARAHLVPRQLRENGLSRRRIQITDDALRRVVRGYTREAGVRNLERELGGISRKIARLVVEGHRGPLVVTEAEVGAFLGPERETRDERAAAPELGLVAGLAWTPAGGEVMFVEASRMPGVGGFRLTGHLGEVMRESAQIALSYVRSRAPELEVGADFHREDIHVHLPGGAIPKDGPSAGVALVTSLVSLLSGTPVREDVGMTGEITLRGRVLPVGGIKEKVLAAHRAGLSTVILPRRNERDLRELPEDVRSAVHFVLIDHVGQALAASLARREGAARQAA